MADGGSSVPRSLCPEACALYPVLFLPCGLPVPSLSRRLSGCRGGQCPGLVPEIRYPFFFLTGYLLPPAAYERFALRACYRPSRAGRQTKEHRNRKMPPKRRGGVPLPTSPKPQHYELPTTYA